MRAGGEYFLEPAEAVQRRYEALRCYFVEDASAESVGARFGYSPATVHQLAAELRAGRSSFFRSSKPGPKGPRKTHTIRDRVLVLRAADRSVTEIAQALTAQGDAVSAQTVWAMKFHRLGPRTVGIHQPADQTTYPPARQSKISTSAIGCVDHPRPRGTPASPTPSKARQPGSPLPRNLPRFAPLSGLTVSGTWPGSGSARWTSRRPRAVSRSGGRRAGSCGSRWSGRPRTARPGRGWRACHRARAARAGPPAWG